MGMQKSDMMTDPLVQETVKVFQDAIAARYQGSPGFGPPPFDPEDCDHPALAMLVAADCLDPLTASVIAAESFAGWVDVGAVASKLNKEVAATLHLLRDDETMLDADKLVSSGNVTALKISVAVVAAMTGGPEFREMKAEASEVEFKMAISQVSGLVTDMADRLAEARAWEVLPPKLLDCYLEGLANIADLASSRVQKRVMNEIIQTLKTDIARANAKEIVETTPPQIDPDSKFEQLKDRARKFKP